mgnify:FL=1
MGLKDLEVKSLLSKIRYIEDELLMSNSVHEELLDTFLSEADDMAKSKGLKPKPNETPIPVDSTDSVSDVVEPDVTSDVKKLYRRIVTRTHPDKLIDVEEDVKIELTNLFEVAVEALEKKDLFCLMKVADKLNIPNITINESHLPIIRNRLSMLEKELAISKDSTVYVWYSADEENKKKILEKYLTFMFF